MSGTSWELSPLYRHCSSQPSGGTLLSAHRERLILRALDSLAITRTWKLPTASLQGSTGASTRSTSAKPAESPPAQFATVAVSPTGLILAYAHRARQAWLLDPTSNDVLARIEVGDEGAVAMIWSPARDGDAVLVWSAHHLRISIYRIATPAAVLHILNPKLVAPAGYSFRPSDARYLAIVERHSGRDHIGIYDAAAWKLHFPLPSTSTDVADLAWSPCGRYLAVWETLTDYLLHIYTPDGRLLSTFAPYAHALPDPTVLAPDLEQLRDERSTLGWVGLGVRTVQWHPSGEWLAVGGWDGKIRVLTRIGWAPVAELECPARIMGAARAWREPLDWIEKTRGKGIVSFDAAALPLSLPTPRPDLTKVNPKMGISTLLWSPSGRFLASSNQSHPTTLFIHQLLSPHFRPQLHAVLLLQLPLRAFAWQPAQPDGCEALAAVSAQKGFATWREAVGPGAEDVVEGVGIPARTDFAPAGLTWSQRGDALLLSDREMYAVAYPVVEGEGVDETFERTWVAGEE